MKEYNRGNVANARSLRRNMTPWERKLWYEFLRNQPVRWQRQKPIGDFIVDFYCAKAQLVVELDGGGHYAQLQRNQDNHRTALLNQRGLQVIRFINRDVDTRFYEVCTVIDRATQERLAALGRS